MSKYFEKSKAEGKIAEKEISIYLINQGYGMIDVSEEVQFQDCDVDFILVNLKGEEYTLEVKSCNGISKSGNILIEDGNYRSVGWRNGWLHNCKADILCYYDNVNKIAYMLHWRKVQKIAKQFKHIHYFNIVDECYADAYLMPLSYAKDNDLVLKEYKIVS